jgi:anionic cell wall polymer biosynthesis LytR-Cps2A-Psr (LCP) family protein
MLDKLKALWAKINQPLADIWEKDKVFFIIFGLVILVAKFRGVLIDLIVGQAKKTVDSAQKEDEKLSKEEKSDSDQADALVAKSDELPKEEPKVTEDWYKNEH